jgi:hypothetical protein
VEKPVKGKRIEMMDLRQLITLKKRRASVTGKWPGCFKSAAIQSTATPNYWKEAFVELTDNG